MSARMVACLAIAILGCSESTAPEIAVAAAVAAPADPPVEANPAERKHGPRPRLSNENAAELRAWYTAVGQRRDGESYGDLIVRAARRQLQRPYDSFRQVADEETLHVDLKTFQCVSLVESSIAVARCIWRSQPNEECFLADVEASRYRGGRLHNYASRLHYFPDWIHDNASRGRLSVITGELGGASTKHAFTFMTSHRGFYPPLKDPAVLEQMRAHEDRLSAREWVVLGRDAVAAAHDKLQNGDIVALVSTKKPGLFIGHTGFIDESPEGVPRLLHASSHHERVLLTSYGLSTYVAGRPYRRGVMVARPLPPP